MSLDSHMQVKPDAKLNSAPGDVGTIRALPDNSVKSSLLETELSIEKKSKSKLEKLMSKLGLEKKKVLPAHA